MYNCHECQPLRRQVSKGSACVAMLLRSRGIPIPQLCVNDLCAKKGVVHSACALCDDMHAPLRCLNGHFIIHTYGDSWYHGHELQRRDRENVIYVDRFP